MEAHPDFKEWMALTYLENQGIAGSLARDMANDAAFPHTSSKTEILAYLRFHYGALTEKYQAAKTAYAEYEHAK